VPDDPEEDERKRAPRRVRRLFYKLDGAGWLTDRRAHIFVASLDGADVRQLTSACSGRATSSGFSSGLSAGRCGSIPTPGGPCPPPATRTVFAPRC